jgi:hypothetical protein
MEAATPLHAPRITVLGNVVVADSLAIRDRVAVELVQERAQAGADPADVLLDAIEIGARVLSREQAEVNADFVRTEFEKVSREVEGAFTDKARGVAEFLGKRVDDVFGPENGHLAKELERLFGAESSVAVQHQLRAVMTEASARMREDLLKQFSSADAHNPLADFKAGTIAAMRRAAEQQDLNLRAMHEQMAALKAEVVKLQAERARSDEVAAEHARSTAKGRPYEEAVFEALATIAHARGDDCDAVGDTLGAGGRKGDVLVGIEGCSGPARARIVFEAKHSQVPRKRALAELDEAMAQRDAAYGVWVVPSEDKLPARTQPLREINGDKLFVVYDPDEGPIALELAYRLARARALMSRGEAEGLDASALRTEVEKALGTMEEVRRIKQQLTHAANGIDAARDIVESLDRRIRAHLAQIDGLLAPAVEAADED